MSKLIDPIRDLELPHQKIRRLEEEQAVLKEDNYQLREKNRILEGDMNEARREYNYWGDTLATNMNMDGQLIDMVDTMTEKSLYTYKEKMLEIRNVLYKNYDKKYLG